MALALGKIKYVEFPLYDYRQHSGNICGHKAAGDQRNGNASMSLGQILAGCHATYYEDLIRKALIARVIKLRCNGLSRKKRRIVERFVNLERKWCGILLDTVKNRMLLRDGIAVGHDARLLKAALSVKFLSWYKVWRCGILAYWKTHPRLEFLEVRPSPEDPQTSNDTIIARSPDVRSRCLVESLRGRGKCYREPQK
jgi:hypothetical protein